ncbi:MAG: UDP-glucose 4-epimerase [Gammaproteobacteria bacterium]|jgi:nucleoside-diphosphate-sugar epimerase|nr:UDP-glucose 4-epimerase [Gammaproteobacteria bacterium]
MKKDITFILGATGLLGQSVLYSGIESITGTKVIGLTRKPNMHPSLMQCSYDKKFIELIQSKGWNVKYIIAAAGFPSVYMSQKDPVTDHVHNFCPVLFTLELARAFNAKVIYISSIEVYGTEDNLTRTEDSLQNPCNFYGLNKQYSERYVTCYSHFFNISYLILRPSILISEAMSKNIIFEHKKALLSNHRVDIYCQPHSILNFIHVNDVSSAIKFLLQRNQWNDVFNVGSNEDLQVSSITQWVEKTFNCTLHINQLDTEYQFKTAPSAKIRALGWQPAMSIYDRLNNYFNALVT